MKDKIEVLKKNKNTLVNYVKCFLNGKKTKEKFNDNQEYKDLVNRIINKK